MLHRATRVSDPHLHRGIGHPSRLHPVTAISRRSPTTSVTCTYVQKVQHKSPGHLACKALYPSSILGAASRGCS